MLDKNTQRDRTLLNFRNIPHTIAPEDQNILILGYSGADSILKSNNAFIRKL